MKIKSILSIAAFATAFVFSVVTAALFVDKSEIQTVLIAAPSRSLKPTSCFGHRKAETEIAAKINYILQKDNENGRVHTIEISRVSRDNKPPFGDDAAFDAYADATARLADQSGEIALDGVPAEFKSAWRRHMKAWRDYADFLEAMKISSVREELGAQTFEALSREHNGEINRSWFEALRVAGENGAATEKYAGIID